MSSAIDTELTRRYRAGRENSTPHQPGAQYSPAAHAEEGQDHMTNLPTPRAAARISAFLDGHPCWTAFWDKKYQVWRVTENDPDSDLYAESRDADAVIRYMSAHS